MQSTHNLKKNITIALLFVFSFALKANTTDKLYQSFIYDKMSEWKQVIDSLQKSTANISNLSQLLDAQYGYIAWCIGQENKKEAEAYIETMEKNLEKYGALTSKNAYYYAYNGALLSYRIGLAKWKAPVLGQKILDATEQALKIDPSNSLALILKANGLFYRPSIFGGDKKEALKIYLQCEQIMAKKTNKDWKYLTLLVNIAQSYDALGDRKKAIEYCNKVLKIENNFLWVKNTYLPKLTS